VTRAIVSEGPLMMADPSEEKEPVVTLEPGLQDRLACELLAVDLGITLLLLKELAKEVFSSK